MQTTALPKLKTLSKQLCFAGVLTAATLGLAACSGKPNIVKCEGLPTKSGKTLLIDAGLCKKLAGGRPVPVKCQQWSERKGHTIHCEDKGSKLTALKYSVNDYVKCYAIVAANMNDCGTKTTACGGSVHVARQKDAWIAAPKGLCTKIKGGVVGKIKG